MDGTLTNQNSWYELNLALGITKEEDQEMYDAYERGDLTYIEWTNALLQLYKERKLATKDYAYSVLSKFILRDGVEDLVTDLQNKGYTLLIISGSFDVLVREVAKTLGVQHYKANTELKFDNQGYLKNIVSAGDEPQAKLRHLEKFCKELQIPIHQCVCVGDGANDIELFKKTQKGITFSNAPENVKKESWHTVDCLSDIKNLL